eukprot:s2231_g10.t2
MPIRGRTLCLCILCFLNTMDATGEELPASSKTSSLLLHESIVVAQNLTWADALTLMEEEPLFRHKLADELKMSPWAAFYWECAPVSLQTAKKRLFEFVIKEASLLENAWDTESFAKYLEPLQGKPAAATFPNLGGSSTLVSPAQDATMTAEDAMLGYASPRRVQQMLEDYKHIGSFFRKASATQHDAVLKAVGDALRERLQRDPKAPFWLNTEGSGVAWYYHYRPYRSKEHGLSSETCDSSSASDIMHKVTFILLSSAGVWARTARGYEEVPVVEEAPEIPEGDEPTPPQAEPAEGEEGQPEVPVEVPPPPEPETRPVALRCEDYIRRVPTPKFQDWKDIETQVLALKNKQGGMIRPYVVCAGIPYGNGEDFCYVLDAFLALFKAAWQTRSTLRVIGEGKNYIPMVHARDVARLTRHIIQVGPELDYHLAVDRGEVTQKALIETVAKQFNLPYEPAPVTVAEAVLAEMADIFTMNIRLEPSPLMEVPWEPPPPEPEEQEVEEQEEEAPKPSTSGTALVPPPVSGEGKTKKSRPNSATSQQPAPEADVLEEEEPAAEEKGKEETLPGFRWWSRAQKRDRDESASGTHL